MGIFTVSFPTSSDKEAMAEFKNVMNEVQDANITEIFEMATKYNILPGQAGDIWYLRTRSRWTQEKEDYLLWCFQSNQAAPDSMMEDFTVPEFYQYRNLSVKDACNLFLRKVGTASRPLIAKSTGKKIRTINAIFIADQNKPVDERIYRLVDGTEGKGSWSNPAQYALEERA